MSAELNDHVNKILGQIREPLELDRWTLRVGSGPMENAVAACEAQPEYRVGDLRFDFDKLQTGDDLAEFVVHEATHCHTWELHTLAEELANAVADTLPEYAREAMRKLLLEKVRQAGERCTSEVGFTYLRLLRRAGILDTPDTPAAPPGDNGCYDVD